MSSNRNRPDSNPLAQKRDGQRRPNSDLLSATPNIRIIFFARRHHVVNMDYLPVEYGVAAQRNHAVIGRVSDAGALGGSHHSSPLSAPYRLRRG